MSDYTKIEPKLLDDDTGANLKRVKTDVELLLKKVLTPNEYPGNIDAGTIAGPDDSGLAQRCAIPTMVTRSCF